MTGLGDLVISNAQLKSGSMVYKLNIEMADFAITVNGIAFSIQKNQRLKNPKNIYMRKFESISTFS
jgi:hypothetical protein